MILFKINLLLRKHGSSCLTAPFRSSETNAENHYFKISGDFFILDIGNYIILDNGKAQLRSINRTIFSRGVCVSLSTDREAEGKVF